MTKRKIIIDTDPGVDDAFALALASKYKDFEILGITSSMGNKGLETTTSNSVRLAKYLNIDCKVYKGSKEYATFGEKNYSQNVHGDDGIGGVSKELSYDENFLSEISAIDFILDSVKKYPNEVEIVALAPLTNIAIAIEKDFELMKNVKAIYSMGGGINTGNKTKFAEFNYYADPKAIEIVYNLGEFVDIYMFGLDVTHNSMMSCNDLFFVNKIGGYLGEMLYKMSLSYQDAYWNFRKMLGCVMHDMLVVAFMIDNSVCPDVKFAKLTTEISGEKRGISNCDFNIEETEKNSLIAISIDSLKYKKVFIETLFGIETVDLYEKSINIANKNNNFFKMDID